MEKLHYFEVELHKLFIRGLKDLSFYFTQFLHIFIEFSVITLYFTL